MTGGKEVGARRSRSIPEAWLGRRVSLVFVSRSNTEYTDGVLEKVNDKGIVLLVENYVGHPAQPLFYPWSAVIQLSEKQDR